jgi:hypothetical protein
MARRRFDDDPGSIGHGQEASESDDELHSVVVVVVVVVVDAVGFLKGARAVVVQM